MKKFSFLLVVSLMLASFTAHAQEYLRGDVDRDGAVNISDVTCLIDNLLKGVPEGDVDQDGSVNISDVTSLIDYLLKGSWSDDPVTPPDSHEWVDLGLPSGTLWATCNVGADTPEDYGDQFAWGETEPKGYYSWSTYKWCNGEYFTLTKYCTYSDFGYNGFVDNKFELDPEDDAAYINWGPSWRTPSFSQIVEICDSCTWEAAQRNGVKGQLLTGPNGNTMFLPAAGTFESNSLTGAGTEGYYWSRTIHEDEPYFGMEVGFLTGGGGFWNCGEWRYSGHSVRAVRVP